MGSNFAREPFGTGQKVIVQFLLDRFQEDAHPKASPELPALFVYCYCKDSAIEWQFKEELSKWSAHNTQSF